MIYDTQMAEINEKKVQELYEEFIHIIGDKYVGEIKDGKKHGYGIYYWLDGSKYEGYYENGLREGYGKMREEGGKYEGYWKQNEREGLGRIFFLMEINMKVNIKIAKKMVLEYLLGKMEVFILEI